MDADSRKLLELESKLENEVKERVLLEKRVLSLEAEVKQLKPSFLKINRNHNQQFQKTPKRRTLVRPSSILNNSDDHQRSHRSTSEVQSTIGGSQRESQNNGNNTNSLGMQKSSISRKRKSSVRSKQPRKSCKRYAAHTPEYQESAGVQKDTASLEHFYDDEEERDDEIGSDIVNQTFQASVQDDSSLISELDSLRHSAIFTISHWKPQRKEFIDDKEKWINELCSSTEIHHFTKENAYSVAPKSPWFNIVRNVLNTVSNEKVKDLVRYLAQASRRTSYFGTLIKLVIERHEKHCDVCRAT